ncbi:hypothetical protein CAPTEDRAFT_206721 [Capitella teleta]|uniref:THAP-type domain-containing protein n=1 Tax=Capitella teleta TaxID=283909 RepID=R7U1Z4_CAPTE|nr:hypothetical protein CAPTEDRAFT_206721 [Capitella teleta]|eukprot:ELT97686.1 hypothetical protein CAPTEDRAFT_206721 [Capitella teleta]
MVKAKKLRKKPNKSPCGRHWCSVINCRSSTGSMIDPRRARWISNARREDLGIHWTRKELGERRVCSLHFKPEQYNCPSDWTAICFLVQYLSLWIVRTNLKIQPRAESLLRSV